MNVKLAEIVELLFFYRSWKFQICNQMPVVVMDLQMSTIGCMNYAHIPESSHIMCNCVIAIVTGPYQYSYSN